MKRFLFAVAGVGVCLAAKLLLRTETSENTKERAPAGPLAQEPRITVAVTARRVVIPTINAAAAN